ncbi:MAG: hypothetical protein ACHQ50_04730 [Fimbriimonadales bacterium]
MSEAIDVDGLFSEIQEDLAESLRAHTCVIAKSNSAGLTICLEDRQLLRQFLDDALIQIAGQQPGTILVLRGLFQDEIEGSGIFLLQLGPLLEASAAILERATEPRPGLLALDGQLDWVADKDGLIWLEVKVPATLPDKASLNAS